MPAEPLRNINEQIVLAAWTNGDGILFQPFIHETSVGLKITEPDTGKVEYVLLTPTNSHKVNPDNGATADTFVYHLDSDAAEEWHFEQEEHGDSDVTDIIDFAYPAIYLNHFNGSWVDPDPEIP